MDFLVKRKKVIYGFCIFLLVMMVGTVVSKGIYASRLPQVTTDHAKSMTIEHQVVVDGVIKPGRELAVNTLDGLRVKKIFVREGDKVDVNALLFQIDTADVRDKMKETELEIQKYTAQITNLQTEQATAILKQQVSQDRATEDYYLTEEKWEEKIKDASKELESAEKKLKECRNNKPKVRLQDDEDEEDYPEIQEWIAKKEALEEKVKEAEKIKKAALIEKEETLLKAKREYEKAQEPAAINIIIQTNELELQYKQESLHKYKKILAKDGKVASNVSGIVTKINVAAGQRTSDQPAILFADTSITMQFETTISKEQKKYVNQGDTISLKIGNHEKMDAMVDYLAQNETNSENYDLTVFLEEGIGAIGVGGILTATYNAEKFPYCIPMEAVMGESPKFYINVLGEKNSILGKELVVEMRTVRVIDKNERYAAIEGGGLDEDSKLIISSTKEIKNGDVVRFKE